VTNKKPPSRKVRHTWRTQAWLVWNEFVTRDKQKKHTQEKFVTRDKFRPAKKTHPRKVRHTWQTQAWPVWNEFVTRDEQKNPFRKSTSHVTNTSLIGCKRVRHMWQTKKTSSSKIKQTLTKHKFVTVTNTSLTFLKRVRHTWRTKKNTSRKSSSHVTNTSLN